MVANCTPPIPLYVCSTESRVHNSIASNMTSHYFHPNTMSYHAWAGMVLPSGKRLENDKASQSFISLKIYIISIRIVLHLTKLYIPGLCWTEIAKHTNMITACKHSPAMTVSYKAGLLWIKTQRVPSNHQKFFFDAHFYK